MRGIKAKRTRKLLYKRPALAAMGYEQMLEEIEQIEDDCDNVQYFLDQEGGNQFIADALDYDDDQIFEFKLGFTDLQDKIYRFREALSDCYTYGENLKEKFDDCTVALIGDRYNIVGFFYDDYDATEKYDSLCGYDRSLAVSDAGKRLMRLTKAEMISTIGQCFGVLIAFLDIRQAYDYLEAVFNILRDENTSLLDTIKEIDELYSRVAKDCPDRRDVERFNYLLVSLPDTAWI